MLEYCGKLVAGSTAAQATAAAKKTATFISQVLAVLSVRGVQERLGGMQLLQPYISMLEAALPSFHTASQQQPSSTATQDTSTATRHRSGRSAAGSAAAGLPPAGPSRDGSGRLAAGQAAAGPRALHGTTTSSSSSKELSLAALVAAVAPFAAQPSSPISTDFPNLLMAWGHLVYGELADPGGIQVAALMLYHWRTLLRFLRLCLQGEATVSSTSTSPMSISTAILHVDGLLHLLQDDTMQALFTQHQLKKVKERFAAIKAVLQSLPQPAPGQAPAVNSFCSAAVEALLGGQSGATLEATDMRMEPSTSALPATGFSAPSLSARSAGVSQELSTAQQQLLSLAYSQLRSGALTPQQLDSVQELLTALKRQVEAAGSNQFETTLLPEQHGV